MADVDFEAEGLLDGLDDEDARAGRLKLLEELRGRGVPLEELRRAVAEDRLAVLPAELILGAEEKYSAEELAERVGVPLDSILRYRQALGLGRPAPDERVWDDDDLAAIERMKQFVDAGLSEEGLTEVARVGSESIARVADAVRQVVGRSLIQPGDTEQALGLRFAQATEALAPLVGPQLEYLFRVHIREQLRSTVLNQAALASGEIPGSQEVTVCFADLVDFTKLGEALPPEELGGVAGRLTELAAEVIEPPVKLVKTIGDAVMVAGPEPAPVVSVALSLVEAADGAGEDFPQLRSGVAHGPALERAGDWYGWPVNLASRVTGVARPASVVVTEEVHEAAADDFAWSPLPRARKLKGIREPVHLYRARFRDGDEASS